MLNQEIILKSTLFIITLLTYVLPRSLQAATWQQVTVNINQNAESINNCLAEVTEKYNNIQPETPADGLARIQEKLDAGYSCLSPILQDYFDDTEVKLNFENTIFTEKVYLKGELTFDLLALKENKLITQNDIKNFSVNNNICETSDLNSLSYQLPNQAKRNFDLQYIANMFAEIIKQNPEHETLVTLNNSLESFTKKNEAISEWDKLKEWLEEDLRRLELGLPHLPFNNSDNYIEFLDSDSPQLSLECASEKGKLSVNNGVSMITFIKQKESQNQNSNSNSNNHGVIFSTGISFGSSTQTITVNGETLTIKSNNLKTTYQELPLVVKGKINPVILPEHEVESSPTISTEAACLEENNPNCPDN